MIDEQLVLDVDVVMTQGERSRAIKKLLEWMNKKGPKGANVVAIYAYIEMEITEMGATRRTAKSYLESCAKACFVETCGPSRWRITKAGKAWLQRHPS